MPSNKETLFQAHIGAFLENEHGYRPLQKAELPKQDFHIIESHLLDFIKATQAERYQELCDIVGMQADDAIIRALHAVCRQPRPLWLTMRNGLEVRGLSFELYQPKPRSALSNQQQQHYACNCFSYCTEYRYNPKSKERIDLVIWLNGLPIIVIELKHEDEGQTVTDAIEDSFLSRDLDNTLYRLPFLYIAASDTEVKVATNPKQASHFRWFNAQLSNQAETEGEYPVEHLYRHALSPDNIAHYLEHFLLFVPAVEEVQPDGFVQKKAAFTIFPRYHQLRASQKLAHAVRLHANQHHELGLKYLINHSAGAGKTLTIAWMADQLDSLHTADNRKVFDNIVILTDRQSLDKNIRDDLDHFPHLKQKIKLAKRSRDLADFLDKDRDIIVSTIQKFGYIQEKLQNSEVLKQRRIAFLIDEAHRSQEGKMALKMRNTFTQQGEYVQEADEEPNTDDIAGQLAQLNIGNQLFVAFTATPTPKTVAFFGEPVDTYSEEEAIREGYILDVAQQIIAYKTMYHLQAVKALPDTEFPAGVVEKALRELAYSDNDLIQYKSEVIVKLFEEQLASAIQGHGKAMVVASSRPAAYQYYQTIQNILREKHLKYGVLFAFSDYTDPVTKKSIEEVHVNQLDTLHGGKLIEDVFDQDEYRILVVANKFQTGFDQPLLAGMFLDKSLQGVNAIQTVSRLNRQHPQKTQDDLLVVDFTNSTENIFKAFNQFRKGSPYKEKEPDPSVLTTLHQQIMYLAVFTDAEMRTYIQSYLNSEAAAQQREAEEDATHSNLKQHYRKLFQERANTTEKRKHYIRLLRRYSKVYYFIARFFKLPEHLDEFIVFAEVMVNDLGQQGKTHDLKRLINNVQLVKGAVVYEGKTTNAQENVNEQGSSGQTGGMRKGGKNGVSPPVTTLKDALDSLTKRFDISDSDAIVIREICEEVSENAEIRIKVQHNRTNKLFLKQFEPKVQSEIRLGYMSRNLWSQLGDPIYTDQGGIIPLMGQAVIDNLISQPTAA